MARPCLYASDFIKDTVYGYGEDGGGKAKGRNIEEGVYVSDI